MWAAAAQKNAAEMVKLLLAKGASVKARAKFSDWPAQITSEPRAQYRPTGGLTPLLYAARTGCYDCVAAILDAGADINLPTPEGVTPLIMALDNENNEIAKLLLDRGANPGAWDWWGRTPLYVAVDRKAAAGGAGRGGRGATPVAARAVSHMAIVNALLDAGVEPSPELNMHRPSRGGNSGRFGESQLSTGATPLFRAVQANDAEVIRALLAKGANPNASAMGFTPFLLAAGVTPGGRGGGPGGAPNTPILDLMLQNGADVNAQVSGTKTYTGRVSRAPSTNEGQSALHAAAQGGRTELVKYLLSKGASPDVLDEQGRKPIDVVGLAAQAAGAPAGRAGAANTANAAAFAEIKALLQSAKK
jgi:ankyrin repeat protein